MKSNTATRREFLVATAAFGAIGLSSGLSGMAHAAPGSTLRVRLDKDIEILDPGYMTGGVEIEAQKQCLPFLAQYTRSEEGFGWEPTYYVTKLVQRDPTHIDFELAEGLTWSNGFGALSAADVKFSYERMKDSDWSGNFDALDHVEVTGERTGTIVLKDPFAPFIMTTLCHGTGAIVSEKAVTEAGGTFTNNFPAICGPYVFEQIPGQRATFSSNPDWTGPKPAYETVQANIIGEVKAAELAFEAGELDCTEVTADTLARYAGNMPQGASIAIAGELQYMWLGMNTEHPKLQDLKVRRAIQHAVDVDSILIGAYSGTTAKSNGIICPGLIGQRTSTKYYSYDPAKARELLDEAGVSGLSLKLRTLNSQERMLAAQIIQANLGAIGISVEVLPLDSGPFWEMGQENKGDTWKDLEIWLMRYGTTPDPFEATQWFVAGQVGIWNWERWTSDEYDSLFKEGISETDSAKRAAIYVRMQEIMEETGAYVWINHEPEAFVHTSEVVVNAAPSGDLNYRRFKPA